jgi:hypothetical protein
MKGWVLAGVMGLCSVMGLWIGEVIVEWKIGHETTLNWFTVWSGCVISFVGGRNWDKS